MFASLALTVLRFAQAGTDYDYSYESTLSQDEAAGLAGLAMVLLLIMIPVIVLLVVSMWKMFEKAGQPGWAALIPFYNGWILAEIGGKPGWWGLVGLGGIIPLIGIPFAIAAFVLNVLISIGVARNFGKDDVFAVLLVLVPIVGFPMLAFSKAQYRPVHPANPAQPTATPPAV